MADLNAQIEKLSAAIAAAKLGSGDAVRRSGVALFARTNGTDRDRRGCANRRRT
jgi:hypothetical protein